METRKIFTVEDLMAAIANNANKKEEVVAGGKWALTSAFYDQVMNDGHIFNPYLHRRFVPSQFLRVLKYHNDVIKAVSGTTYGFEYSLEWLREEVRKLAFLQEADPIAFEERKVFLPIDAVKTIIEDYVSSASVFINESFSRYRSVRIGKHRYIYYRDGAEGIVGELFKFGESVRSAITYETLNTLLQAHEFVRMPYEHRKSGAFVEAFVKGGAYYTLKHLVLFEHFALNGKTGADACTELTNYLGESASVVCEALNKTLTDNNYKF